MPFSCISENKVIYAEDISAAEWEDLKLRLMRGTANLILPCCRAKASLRSVSGRRQHFAHCRGESCKSDCWGDYSGRESRKGKKSESLDHQRVKEIIREVAANVGWHAETEYEGLTPSGDRWRADVFAEKDVFRVAFEIQVTPQQFSYYRIRQQRYRESGVKGIWLSCRMPEVSDEEIPVFELSKSKGVYVVDFPEFVDPDLLKLSKDFTGTSLGEFIQRML
jgi:competence protein CoiA